MSDGNGATTLTDPFSLKDEDGYSWVKGNLHSHTTNSDGKAEPQERLDGYVGQGYDFLCLSDHYDITRIDTVSHPDNFILIQGAELHPKNPFGGETHHFVALNIHEDMDSTTMPPQLVIDTVREQGGNIWLAHPHWSRVNILRDTYPLEGLAGVEVFNSTCRRMGRGESGVHWDDWMMLKGHVMPALCNDDSHAREGDRADTYEGWTMARVKERTADAVVEALVNGASYGSTGPQIHGIDITRTDGADGPAIEASVRCSPAQRIVAVSDTKGASYHEHGALFEAASVPLAASWRWVRFEVIGPDGAKAWSNPFDLTTLAD
jgi:hypothetical protein